MISHPFKSHFLNQRTEIYSDHFSLKALHNWVKFSDLFLWICDLQLLFRKTCFVKWTVHQFRSGGSTNWKWMSSTSTQILDKCLALKKSSPNGPVCSCLSTVSFRHHLHYQCFIVFSRGIKPGLFTYVLQNYPGLEHEIREIHRKPSSAWTDKLQPTWRKVSKRIPTVRRIHLWNVRKTCWNISWISFNINIIQHNTTLILHPTWNLMFDIPYTSQHTSAMLAPPLSTEIRQQGGAYGDEERKHCTGGGFNERWATKTDKETTHIHF